jgi:hypothetical protein
MMRRMAGTWLLAFIAVFSLLLAGARPPDKPCPGNSCHSAHPSIAPSPTIAPTPIITPSPTPTTQPTPIPSSSNLPSWTLVWNDEFTTWDSSKYFVYPNTWTNHYTGHYDPSIISSDGSKLRIFIHTDQYPRIAAFCPVPPGSLSSRGDFLGLRVEFRIRADRMVGYKGVPLLWPKSGIWPRDGESDWPESSYDKQPAAFMHWQNATSGSQQDYYNSPTGTSWQDWHTYVNELKPGISDEFLIDGVSIGKSTSNVPNTPMHLVMQFETNLTWTLPDPAVQGYVEIENLKVWSYTP